MNREVLKRRAQQRISRPRLARGQALALALLSASFVAGGRAEAACSPTSPVNNTTVTCTGTTTDQNGTTGYGNSFDTGNTYNILSGASVTGTRDGLSFDSGTVNNSGSITGGGSFGVSGNDDAIVNNSGARARVFLLPDCLGGVTKSVDSGGKAAPIGASVLAD